MKERPILFSAPMVRSLLDGTKTQTRRVIKQQPERRQIEQVGSMLGFKKRHGDGFWLWPNAKDQIIAECPYGRPGDRLWVRESWSAWAPHPDNDDTDSVIYRATDSRTPDRWRPSIHMPRWASRITLEVTCVRVERLQDINAADALAEGVNVHPDHHGKPTTSIYSPVQAYRDLWESINGPGSWDANPWVWITEFRRIES